MQESFLNRSSKLLLLVDCVINYLLGAVLVAYSEALISLLGLPSIELYFYPNILGAVLIGIGIALHIEYQSTHGLSGLGLAGAIGINLAAGLMLLTWLLFGDLDLPLKGKILLWTLDIFLIAISIFEYVALKRK